MALAIVVAPVATALCLSVALLATPQVFPGNNLDLIGGAVTFFLLALIFGSLLSALPTLVIGSIAIGVARSLGTRSPIFFGVAGCLGGLFMAWVDTQRTQSVFAFLAAVPFLIGGCASGFAYWRVAERR